MTPPGRYDFCKMFVRAATPADVLDALAGVRDDRVDVLRNPDAGRGDESDFLFWPVLVEIESNGSDAVVGIAAQVITHLWERGYPTVAACDYEHELPWRGGIARLDA